jgi:hypothetical protein
VGSFEKGHKKLGGRKAGTPNKATQSLMDKCEAKGLDVFEALIDVAQDGAKNFEWRFAALKELAQYLYPKRKAIEVSTPSAVEQEAERFAALSQDEQVKILESELRRLKGEA